MLTQVLAVVAAALIAAPASGQNGASPDRVLRWHHAPSAGISQITSVLRSVTALRIAVDEAQKEFAVWGPAPEIALAEWLLFELDTPDNAPALPLREYRLPGGELTRIIRLEHARSQAALQMMVNAARTMGAPPGICPILSRSAVVLRGAESLQAPITWLFRQLDKPPEWRPSGLETAEYEFPDERSPAMRVFYLANCRTRFDLQLLVNLTRTTFDVQRVFPYEPSMAVAMRGAAEQAAGVAWILGELDRSVPEAVAGQAEGRGVSEFRLAGNPGFDPRSAVYGSWESLVRIFRVRNVSTEKALGEVAQVVRRETKSARVCPYPAQRAIAFRGTDHQVATAERLIREMDGANLPAVR